MSPVGFRGTTYVVVRDGEERGCFVTESGAAGMAAYYRERGHAARIVALRTPEFRPADYHMTAAEIAALDLTPKWNADPSGAVAAYVAEGLGDHS